ncbi:DUF2637 domain-containing protein [Nocardia sp. CDC159]|uniref:DUF2637 domain-containing protein n=1 Tax=Nocardia pulmonis TaxID=2951408 RepID=A0A9X2IXE0_9NOCA|nr:MULTISPECIES: DUF2637 domain-containing protein [Nocardia]MCM6774549.1 DUF2637 domain-containing protein [Nocardia pulmonis]MCM6787385.1 DUF2637 domain-containing protein [Nocardia sp. CDC159]
MSVTGNAIHAVLNVRAQPIVAAAVAVVPPVILLDAVHGVTVLLRARARAGAAHLISTTMTLLIAIGSFWLSFTALRAFAEMAGISHAQAWLWPLIVEGSMTQATIALITLAHPSQPLTVRPPHTPAMERSEPTPAAPSTVDSPTAVEQGNGDYDAVSACAHLSWADIATIICDRDRAHRRDRDEVVRILIAHYDRGLVPSEIARTTERSRSTVSRIIKQAAQIRGELAPGAESANAAPTRREDRSPPEARVRKSSGGRGSSLPE